jgi:hypothetical protein
VWLSKLLRMIVSFPVKLISTFRNHRTRKNARFAAKTIRRQAKEAKQAAKQPPA